MEREMIGTDQVPAFEKKMKLGPFLLREKKKKNSGKFSRCTAVWKEGRAAAGALCHGDMFVQPDWPAA